MWGRRNRIADLERLKERQQETIDILLRERDRLTKRCNELEMAAMTHLWEPDEIGEMPR